MMEHKHHFRRKTTVRMKLARSWIDLFYIFQCTDGRCKKAYIVDIDEYWHGTLRFG